MGDKPLESPATQLLNNSTRAVPKHLRVSAGGSNCSNCLYFEHVPGRAWRRDGKCGKHNAPVREDFICEDHASAHM